MQIKKFVSMFSRTGRDLQRYNFDGCRQVVGCIPYRFRKNHKPSSVHGTLINELEFLLISSQKSTKMMFPKGGWELDETIEDAARRETMEEAGVLGVVGKKLGVWSFKSKSQDAFHEGHMLAFRVTQELDCWPEKDVRNRVWLSADDAKRLCAHEWMKEALDIFLVQLDIEEGEPQPPTLLDLLRVDESNCARLIFQRRRRRGGGQLYPPTFSNEGRRMPDTIVQAPSKITMFHREVENELGITKRRRGC